MTQTHDFERPAEPIPAGPDRFARAIKINAANCEKWFTDHHFALGELSGWWCNATVQQIVKVHIDVFAGGKVRDTPIVCTWMPDDVLLLPKIVDAAIHVVHNGVVCAGEAMGLTSAHHSAPLHTAFQPLPGHDPSSLAPWKRPEWRTQHSAWCEAVGL